jgi:hypothetical protein
MVTTIFYNGLYVAIIPKQSHGAHVDFYVEAEDVIGNSAQSSVFSYTIPAANYNLYIFLIALIAVILMSMIIVRRIKKGRKPSGPDRYKLVKVKF